MTIRPAQIPGLPDDIEVRRSDRRRRSVAAFREGGKTIVVVPARMSNKDISEYAKSLHARLERKAKRTLPSDAQLEERANKLAQQYLPEVGLPTSIRWTSRQNSLWGSCTSADRSIRLSDRLQGMPAYVVDSVIIHELAHLAHPNHGPEFGALLSRYPDAERAEAYLAGVEFARVNG